MKKLLLLCSLTACSLNIRAAAFPEGVRLDDLTIPLNEIDLSLNPTKTFPSLTTMSARAMTKSGITSEIPNYQEAACNDMRNELIRHLVQKIPHILKEQETHGFVLGFLDFDTNGHAPQLIAEIEKFISDSAAPCYAAADLDVNSVQKAHNALLEWLEIKDSKGDTLENRALIAPMLAIFPIQAHLRRLLFKRSMMRELGPVVIRSTRRTARAPGAPRGW